MRPHRALLIATALASALSLSACEGFDPVDKFAGMELFGNSKTPLPGERRPVFPQGVPGVEKVFNNLHLKSKP